MVSCQHPQGLSSNHATGVVITLLVAGPRGTAKLLRGGLVAPHRVRNGLPATAPLTFVGEIVPGPEQTRVAQPTVYDRPLLHAHGAMTLVGHIHSDIS